MFFTLKWDPPWEEREMKVKEIIKRQPCEVSKQLETDCMPRLYL